MDIRQLKHFVAVFEQRNLSKAAEAIPLSQPALTRSMKTLEDQLGVELFQRHARGATPTAAGERLYHHAKSILAECARARRDALQPVGELAGTVSVGIGALFASRIVDAMVGQFCVANPKARVIVRQGYFEELLRQLDLGQIELAFINFPLLALPDSMEFEPLVQVHTSVYVATDHPLANAETISMEAIRDARWASVDQPHALEVLESLFLSANVAAPRPAIQSNSLTLIRSLVLSNGFAGLLPDHMFTDEIANGSVVRLDVPSTPLVRSAGIITRKEAFHRPLALALAEQIRETIASEAGNEEALLSERAS
ncbi:MAG: LysR family transcriptional regulator [Pseudomonadota bacterium]